MSNHPYRESGSGFCAICDDARGEGEHAKRAVPEEPSYMMFARINVRDGLPSTPAVVKELLARIDRLEGK